MPAKRSRNERFTRFWPCHRGRHSDQATSGRKAKSTRATIQPGAWGVTTSILPASHSSARVASSFPVGTAMPVQLRTAVSRKPAITAEV